MKRQRTHADWTLLLWGQFPERTNILLRAEVELASSFIEFLLDGLAFCFMLLPVLILAVLVAIPNALAGPALHEGTAFLAVRRTHLFLGWGPVFRVGSGFAVFLFCRFAERHGTELLSSRGRRWSVLSR